VELQRQHQYPHQRLVSACGHGGPDGHGGLLEATQLAAHACLTLWASFGETAPAPSASAAAGPRPMLAALEDGVEWSCCPRAWRVQKHLRMLVAEMGAEEERRRGREALREEQARPPSASIPVYRAFAPTSDRPSSGAASGGGAPFVHPSQIAAPMVVRWGLHPRPVIPGEFHALMRGSSVLRLPDSQPRLPEEDEVLGIDRASSAAVRAKAEHEHEQLRADPNFTRAGSTTVRLRPTSALRGSRSQVDHSVRPLTARSLNSSGQPAGSTKSSAAALAAKMQRRLNRENRMFV